MKWLFSTLLIINLGLFIWLLPQRDDVSANGDRIQNVGKLQLVGESDEAAAFADLAAMEPPPLPPPDTGEIVLTAIDDEPPEEPPAPDQTPPPEIAKAPPEPVCGSLGEFAKRSQVELLSVRMLARGAKTEIISESSNEQAGFWVLIPPQRDRNGAIAVSKQLEAAGITDLWRFTSGELAHAISLGLFSDEDRARARRDKIAALGFDPQIKPRYREQTRFWLNYRFTGDEPLNKAEWQRLTEEYPGLERTEESCP
jgi:hypothetical protein